VFESRSEALARLRAAYWRANLRLMAVLLTVWAAAGLGAGVLFAGWLNQFTVLGGVPLGFWFAQQGSIIVFVLVILVYALLSNRRDRRFRGAVARLEADAVEGGEA